MTVFGDGAFRAVIKADEVVKVGPQPNRTGVLIHAPPHGKAA